MSAPARLPARSEVSSAKDERPLTGKIELQICDLFVVACLALNDLTPQAAKRARQQMEQEGVQPQEAAPQREDEPPEDVRRHTRNTWD